MKKKTLNIFNLSDTFSTDKRKEKLINKDVKRLMMHFDKINGTHDYYSIRSILLDINVIFDLNVTEKRVFFVLSTIMKNYLKGYAICYGDFIFLYKSSGMVKHPILIKNSENNRSKVNAVSRIIDLHKLFTNKRDLIIVDALQAVIKSKLKMYCAVKIYKGIILNRTQTGKVQILFNSIFLLYK